jgi:hypothetical protein
MTPTIADAAQRVCEAAAEAVHRYATVTGLSPSEDLPERFITAFVLDKLGDEVTLTLETSLSKLWRWNLNALKGLRLPIPENPEEEFALIAAELGAPRVDMAIWAGEGQKDEQDCFAIIEFKNWKIIERERDKVYNIIKHLICPHGAICVVMQGSAESLGWAEDLARKDGDGWFACNVAATPENPALYSVCIRYFDRR